MRHVRIRGMTCSVVKVVSVQFDDEAACVTAALCGHDHSFASVDASVGRNRENPPRNQYCRICRCVVCGVAYGYGIVDVCEVTPPL